ncbi:hypothetical protein GOP47_0013464 [Adiantum capillus-veneris]|uniref:Protein Lines C-terminal domain-containing protein n=1 Tax=Adiantum capillus-veneris TaxID=13818 RepID=A0A9D4ZD81_ADICA|nr:hypothetical protein GOP47_0013464 [Adiantum capillus-veneris]
MQEDGQCQEDKNGSLNAALSRVQRGLNSRSVLLESDKKLQLEIQDCAVSEGVASFCKKDVEGLASNLIVLLASENSFTRHSVRKTFVALFSYLHGSVSLGVFLTGFLWNALKGCFFGEREFKSMKRGVHSSCLATKYGYSISGLKIGMPLLQILHDILRKFKSEESSSLEGFVACTEAHMAEVFVAFSTCFRCLINNSVERKLEVEDDLMLAALLRFLCSFIHLLCIHPGAINMARILPKNHMMALFVPFLEGVSQYCLSPHQTGFLSHYLCHKFLMLMFRLHSWFIEWPPLASTCSEILRSNTNNLCPSLFVKQTSPPAPLLLSPFAACHAQSKAHLFPFSVAFWPEKHAVFLIFKLEFSSARIPYGSSTRKGDVWLLKWLLSQMSLPGDPSISGTAVLANWLASSFLQIFIDEDMLLLEILLLLQDCPISDLFSRSSDYDSSPIAQKLLVEVFKPIRLFAVFLSLISYDHSVMIDFLIAKDTGVVCLQYLLRSMRLVRSTWPELLSLSDTPSTLTGTESFCQVDNQAVKQLHSSASFAHKASWHDKVIDINRVVISMMKLKHAIKKLHEKHAFPYNPSPLLKHLDFLESDPLVKAMCVCD